MATSLAKQLQKLKVEQKDEIVLPQRTKLSFLFDIKQAANIDDQSLYFLCLNALNSIQKQNLELHQKLQPFQQNIISESSLNFYRGTQTKEQLEVVDDKIQQILGILSPYYLTEQETHKIIEYLIRIYEINAFHKYELIFGFLPYYETIWFMKISQLVNLKEDKWLEWLHEFSFKGEQVSKQVLVRAMNRNQASLFDLYAKWLFRQEIEHDQNKINVHHQFLGFILSNILKGMLHSNKNSGSIEYQQILYTLLPHISRCMKSNSSYQLISIGFMAIGYLGCGNRQENRLTAEYAKAFLKQAIITLKNLSQENGCDQLKITGIKVLVGLLEFQQDLSLEADDIKSLLQITKIGNLFNTFSLNFDLSCLMIAICETIKSSQDHQLFDIFSKFLQNSKIQLSMKTFYLMTNNLIFSLIDLKNQDQILSRENLETLNLIQFLKQLNRQYFDKIVLHILKQNFNVTNFKENLSTIISSQEKDNMIEEQSSPFIKPFSLLSSLCSQIKQVQQKTLQSLKDETILTNQFVSKQELSLVIVQLSQQLSEAINDEIQGLSIVEALNLLTLKSEDIEYDVDYVFQKVEYAIHLRKMREMILDDQNNQDFDSSLLQFAIALKPLSHLNLKQQAYLTFFSNQKINCSQNSIEMVQFLSTLQKKQKKVDHIIENQEIAFEFVYDILSSQQLQPDIYIDQYIKNQKRSYLNLEQADYILSVLSEVKRDENQEAIYLQRMNKIFLILQQTVYDKNDSETIQKILTCLIKSFPQSNKYDEIVKNFLIVCLLMKQKFRNDFNMLVLHNLLFKQYFKSDKVAQLKFYFNLILDSEVSEHNQQQQDLFQLLFIFSIEFVKSFVESKTFMIDWASTIFLILSILDSSKQFSKNQLKLKQMAIQLAETFLEQSLSSKLEFKDIYDSLTIKQQPSHQISQEKYTPVKPQIAQQFLQNLIDNKTSIYQDDSQITYILKKLLKSEKSQGKQTFFLNLVQILPKLQSVIAKQNLLKQLLISERQSLVFMMALSEILQQELDFFEKGAHNELAVIKNIGKLIQDQLKMGNDENDIEQQEFLRVIAESLSLNLMKFCAKNLDADSKFDKSTVNDLKAVYQEQAINIYNKQIITILKEESQFKLLKIHLLVNAHFDNQMLNINLQYKFITQSENIFSGEQISKLFNEQIEEIRQNKLNQNKVIQLVAVTMQLKVKNSNKSINTYLILLQKLVDISEQQNVSILISMMCQLIDETVQSSRDNLESLRILKVDDEINQIVLNAVKNKFLPQLTSYVKQKGQIDFEDPFNKFMSIIVEEENKDQVNDEDLFDNIVSQMQIIRDVNRVAASTEIILEGVAKRAICSLNEIADYLQRVDIIFSYGQPRQFSQKEERIIRHLFRFYYMLVKQTLETFPIQNEQNDEIINCSQRDMLAQFVKTVQKISMNNDQSSSKIFSRENTIHQYKNYLIDIINVCGIYQHGHLAFIFLFLFDESQNEHQSSDFQLEILLSSFKQSPEENSLSLLSNLLSTLSYLYINKDENNYKLDDKLKILESTQPTDKQRLVKASAFWLSSKFQQLQDKKYIISLKSRIINQIDKWVNKESFKQNQNKIVIMLTEIVQKQNHDTQYTSKWIKDEFLWFNLSLSVIKDEVNFILSQKTLKTEKQSGKILRLKNIIDKLLKSLNEMISLEIHAGMVLKIMKIQDSNSLSLKTSLIHILIDKAPNLFLEATKQNQAQLSPIFSPLVSEACNFIVDQKNIQKQIKKNIDMQNYLASLFALIKQTANENLSQNLKSTPIKLTFEIQKALKEENQKINLALHSQILLCQQHLFEVYYQSQSLIEFLPEYTDMIITQAHNSQIYFKNEQFFSFQYAQSLLKAILSLISINYMYLGNMDKWEQLLKLLIVFDKKFSKEIEQILEIFIQKAPTAIGDENNLQVVFNTFQDILIDRGCKNQEELPYIQIVSIRFFKILLFRLCKNISKEAIKENYMIIGEFFKSALDFPRAFFKNKNQIDLPNIDEIEKEIVESFQQFVIRLNEEQLGQIILSLVKWSKKNQKNKEKGNDLGFDLHRQIIFYKIMSACLETLGEYAVPYIQYYLQSIIDISSILIHSINSIDDSNKKRTKLLQQNPNILESQSIDGQGHTFVKLLRQICINLTLNFSKDINSFIQADIFEKIAEPIVSQMITLSAMKKQFKPFIDEILKPLIFEMIERIDNSQLQIQFNNSILMKSRQNYNASIRLASLEIEQYLFTKLGERYLIVLNDTLPYLSECLEDDDHDVEMVAKEVIKKIETLTGESIQEYLK